ncbi:hypothetical protein ACJJIE_11930 [Microbulbifer sp. TRSA001]|uniref:hypothetical protein n=1 Tax=Microbulbifer sp. TRSA001 TaxID=3243381 RepID=UPI00403922DF
MRKSFILVFSVITAVLAVLVILSNQGVQAVLAGIFGVSASVLVGLIAIDPIQELLEQRRWEKAKKLIFPMLRKQIKNIADESIMSADIDYSHKMLGRFDTIANFNQWVEETELAVEKNGNSNHLTNQVVGLIRHPDVEWSLDEIRLRLIPRLYLLAPSCQAVEKSLAFEKAHADLMDTIIMHERVVTGSAGKTYLKFVESTRDFYKSLILEEYE